MKLYTVWKNNSQGIEPWQKCLINENEDYIGIKNGAVYSKEEHYHSQQYLAKIINVDNINQTGMYHLDADSIASSTQDENNKTTKSKFIGCIVTIEAAHIAGKNKVYRCLELDEYFSDNELELLESDSDDWKAYDNPQLCEVI